jgi:hypothetical protein
MEELLQPHAGELRRVVLRRPVESAPRKRHYRRRYTAYIITMCGRATYKLTWEEIVALYRLTLDQARRRHAFRLAANRRANYELAMDHAASAGSQGLGRRATVSGRPRHRNRRLKKMPGYRAGFQRWSTPRRRGEVRQVSADCS